MIKYRVILISLCELVFPEVAKINIRKLRNLNNSINVFLQYSMSTNYALVSVKLQHLMMHLFLLNYNVLNYNNIII